MLRTGLDVPDEWLGVLYATHVDIASPLPQGERDHLGRILTAMYPVLCRLDPDAAPSPQTLRAIQESISRTGLAVGPRPMPIAFISSTSEDLQEYRAKARDAALRLEFMPRMMEYFAASGKHPPLEACLARISGSDSEAPADVLVVIVAHRYGWVPPDQAGSEGKSITWLECEKARENGKEILAFLVDEKYVWPDDLREENRVAQAVKQGTARPEFMAEVQDNVKRLRQFKTWLDSLGIRATFTTPESLMTEVLDALRMWKQRHAESQHRQAAVTQQPSKPSIHPSPDALGPACSTQGEIMATLAGEQIRRLHKWFLDAAERFPFVHGARYPA